MLHLPPESAHRRQARTHVLAACLLTVSTGLLSVITGLLSVGACLVSVPAQAVEPLLSATIEPSAIALGEAAQLTITSTGSGLENLQLPKVPGLEFRVVGQSRRVQIINGATLSSNSVIVRVVPQTAGVFSIPGLSAQPLLLRVSPDNGSGSSPYGSMNSQRRPPISPNGTVNGEHLAEGAAFVHMNLPKRDVYVGESIPVDIEVGMRSGFVTSLNGLPTLTGSDFTLNNLSHQPERVEKVIDGQPFTLLTWHSVLAPVKPGTFKLSIETPLTIRVRTRPQRDTMIEDLLGDPFMQNFFGATVQKEVTVASQATDLKVLALPTEGRPHDFSGAVGSFKISSDLSQTTAAVGDPLTLRMHVTGAGNFDRVDSPLLERLDDWKTYPPKSNFKASDTVGAKGEKTFEQPLIASRPGRQTLPSLTFNYFDPTTKRYESAHAAPLDVTIDPSLAQQASQAPAIDAAAAPLPTTDRFAGALKPDHAVTDDTGTLEPLYFQPRFLVLPSVLTVLSAGAWLALRRRTRDADDHRSRRRRLTKEADRLLKQLEAAARTANAPAFFEHARTALQFDLGTRWQMPPADVTADEVSARLGAEGDELVQLFKLADETSYAGATPTTTDFARWMQIVRRRLADGRVT